MAKSSSTTAPVMMRKTKKRVHVVGSNSSSNLRRSRNRDEALSTLHIDTISTLSQTVSSLSVVVGNLSKAISSLSKDGNTMNQTISSLFDTVNTMSAAISSLSSPASSTSTSREIPTEEAALGVMASPKPADVPPSEPLLAAFGAEESPLTSATSRADPKEMPTWPESTPTPWIEESASSPLSVTHAVKAPASSETTVQTAPRQWPSPSSTTVQAEAPNSSRLGLVSISAESATPTEHARDTVRNGRPARFSRPPVAGQAEAHGSSESTLAKMPTTQAAPSEPIFASIAADLADSSILSVQPKPTFMTIPAELRLKIYEYVLSSRWYTFAPPKLGTVSSVAPRNNLSILVASRFVRNEAIEVLLDRWLILDKLDLASLTYLPSRGIFDVARLRNIAFDADFNDISLFESLMDFLRKAKNIQNLELHDRVCSKKMVWLCADSDGPTSDDKRPTEEESEDAAFEQLLDLEWELKAQLIVKLLDDLYDAPLYSPTMLAVQRENAPISEPKIWFFFTLWVADGYWLTNFDVIVDLISRDVAIVDRHGAAYVVPEVIFCDGVTGALDLSDGQKFGMEELPEDYR